MAFGEEDAFCAQVGFGDQRSSANALQQCAGLRFHLNLQAQHAEDIEQLARGLGQAVNVYALREHAGLVFMKQMEGQATQTLCFSLQS